MRGGWRGGYSTVQRREKQLYEFSTKKKNIHTPSSAHSLLVLG